MKSLSDTLLEFLETHPGEAFTAAELRKRVAWPGNVGNGHVLHALTRRLFPEGVVAANGDVRLVGGTFPIQASSDTRWAALEGAPAGFVAYDPLDGIYEHRGEQEWAEKR